MTTSTVEAFDPTPRFTASLQALMARADAQAVPTGMLATLAAAPFGGGILRDGQSFADTVTQRQWEGMYSALAQSVLPHAALGTFAPLHTPADIADAPPVVPIGLLSVRYQQPTRRLMARIFSAQKDDTAIDIPTGPLLEERTAFAASALLAPSYWGFERQDDVHTGLTVQFHLDPARMVSNLGEPDLVEVDFDDGLGLREMPLGSQHTVTYEHAGQRRVVLQAQYGAETRSAAFLFQVADTQALAAAEPTASNPVVFMVGANIPHRGRKHICRVVVHLGKGHTTITKPFVLAEGFPGGTRPQDLYDRINGKVGQTINPDAKLADELRAKGFDVALIFFQDGGAQIQGNAYVYLAVLQELWKRMGTTGSIVAAGGSMGGLIARYALAYAETHNLPTGNVSALMTFDSPHQGANVPLAIQCVSRFFGPKGGDDTNRILDLPAARQMLTAQRWTWDQTEPIVKPDFTDFYSELERLGVNGYPSKIRKLAISNGSGSGASGIQPLKPGVIWRLGGWDLPLAKGEAWGAPNGGGGSISWCDAITVRFIGRVYSIQGDWYGRDGCAGGTASFFGDMAKSFRAQKGRVDEHVSLASFVPAHSALGVRVTNAYTFKADELRSGQTPFDAWYVSRTNDAHATVDKGIKEWVLGMVA